MPPIHRVFLGRLSRPTLTGWSSLTLGPFILTGILLFGLWLGTFTRIQQEESITLDNTQLDNHNIAKIVAANLDEILGKTKLYADMATSIATRKQDEFSDLKLAFSSDHAFPRWAVFDPRGRLLFSSAHSAEEPLLSALVAQAKKSPATVQNLLVGYPDAASGDAWRVPILIPLGEQANLGFLGGHLDLGFFLRLYQDINLGNNGTIEIISNDGYRLIESGGSTISAGLNIAGSDYFAFIQKGNEGRGISRRPGERTDSVITYVQLDRFPFTVAISKNYDDVLAENHRRQKHYFWEATIQTLVLLIAAIYLTILARRQQRFFRVAQKSEQEKQRLIEQLELEKNKAYVQASHDHLTGLPNRMHFADVATTHLSNARRSPHFCAVFFIDLDRFKLINDTLGHRVGDLLLCEVANRLRNSVRGSDLVSRFGGDEFVMLITEAATIDDLGMVAAKIIDAVGQPCNNLDGHDLEIHPSLGIALYGRDGHDIENLLKCADAAMYEAKAAGRGTYRFFDVALNRASELHVALAQRLRHAIVDREFCLYFQARVALEDFRVTGLEALVRWQHPEHGLLAPSDFIPMAEEEGLIVSLGYWIIESACSQLAEWRSQGLTLVPIAINISPKQLRDGQLVKRIIAALEMHFLPGDLLEIEITESCVIDDIEIAIAQLNKLRARGIRIFMDDYGVGFSNLSLLKTLPIQCIKIDRSLISDIHNHTHDAIIVDSTITLAHKLQFTVVAEGVETREQIVHLKLAGCDEVQGYYFQRPAPANEIEPILHRGYFAQ